MRHIIAIVGMPGAGKSAAGNFFKNKGMQVLRFGSVIDDGLKDEGKEWSAENNQYYRQKIRLKLGMAGVAIKMLPKIEHAIKEGHKIVLDGLYSWEEYMFLQKKLPNLFLLCVYARPEIRYERLSKRRERPFTREEARERDINEIERTNKGGPIAIADYLIANEESEEEFEKKLEEFWKKMQ